MTRARVGLFACAVVLALAGGCKKGGKKAQAVAGPLLDAGVAAAPTPDAAPVRPRGRDIMIVIESRPGGATVTMDGRKLGVAPMTEPAIGDGREHEFRFSLDGHDDAIVKMMLMRDGVVTGVLRPRVAGLIDSGAAGAPAR